MENTTTAVIDTPSSAPAPSAAPSVSTTPSDPTPVTPSERPSFKKALVQAEQQTAAPTITPPLDAATTPPGATATHPTPPASKGPIPFEVHSKALDNARAKARTEVEGEFRQQYGDPAEVAESVQWRNLAKADPGTFLEKALLEGLTDPVAAPRVKQLLGKMLGSMRQPAPGRQVPSQTDAPRPDFRDEQGNEFYSAKTQAQRDEWLKNTILAEIAPLKQEVEGSKAEREADQRRQQADAQQRQVTQQITSHLTKARSWPHFEAHEAAIKQALAAMPLTSGHPAEEALALREAYDAVVLPKLSELEQNRVLAQMNARANDSTLNPSNTGAPTGIPKNVRAKDGGTFGNALRYAEQRAAGR